MAGARPRPSHPTPKQGGDEGDLTGFDAEIEGQKRERDLVLGQADLGQGACEAQSMEQSEHEGQRRRAPAPGALRRIVAADQLHASIRIERAISASIGATGNRITPRADIDSVMLCARVKAVAVTSRRRQSFTKSTSANTNRR